MKLEIQTFETPPVGIIGDTEFGVAFNGMMTVPSFMKIPASFLKVIRGTDGQTRRHTYRGMAIA
jgi:hypothetical protein